ncbi:unnamed protein product [Medioppia subpectinata]|uniref:Uncharacterized protein n=1 Tax=Medioppia subpectinata TaxID=1979941 RepID=A0A7R9KJD0_9ACAR|nr:unnamed protein product [Medioppia subpectinata]CAG2104605.1 unnamed protein product [Medioppia subpectinata]
MYTVKDHYHSHRLSFWLNLIPRLHNAGEEQVYLRHHLLTDHENMASYDGIVRQIAFKFFAPIPNKSMDLIPVNNTSITSKSRKQYDSPVSNINTNDVNVNDDGTNESHQLVVTTDSVITFYNNQSIVSTDVIPMIDRINLNANNNSMTAGIAIGTNYSTALLVTIAIGCSLLILNMLIFAGVYYQLDKNSALRHHKKAKNRSASSSDHHSSYHYNDTPKSQEMVVLATPEKRLLQQKSPNLSHNHVEIVNTNFADHSSDQMVNNQTPGGGGGGKCCNAGTIRSNDTVYYNQKTFGFEHSHHSHHSSPVPSCLSNSDTTTTSIIHVPLGYDKSSNDTFAPEIRV